jgi:hypothetical protein
VRRSCSHKPDDGGNGRYLEEERKGEREGGRKGGWMEGWMGERKEGRMERGTSRKKGRKEGSSFLPSVHILPSISFHSFLP